MREAELPDGTILEFPDETADDVMDQVVRQHLTGSAQAQAVPHETPPTMNPILRTIGQAGRTISGAAASLPDTALLIPKTLAAGGEYIAEKAGLEGTGLEKTLQKIRTTPSMNESVKGIIDQATNNQLQPRGLAENLIMGGGELAFSGGALNSTLNKANPPGVLDAVKGVLNPASTLVKKPLLDIPDQKIRRLTAEELRKRSSEYYKQADELGGALKPEITNKWLEQIAENDFTDELVKEAQNKLGGGAANKVKEVFEIFKNQPMTLQRHQQLDELLGNLVEYDLGRPTKEGMEILDIQHALRNIIEEATDADIVGDKAGFEALKKARKLWSRSLRLKDIEKIMQRAEMMDRPDTGIKTGMRTLANNEKRLRGFSKAEIAAIKKAAETGGLQELLKTFGSRLIPVIATGTGGSAAGVAASYAVPALSRKASEAVKFGQAENIANMVAGTPSSLPALPSAGKQTAAGLIASLIARMQQ